MENKMKEGKLLWTVFSFSFFNDEQNMVSWNLGDECVAMFNLNPHFNMLTWYSAS